MAFTQIDTYRDTPIVRNDRWLFGFPIVDGDEGYHWEDTMEKCKEAIDSVKRITAKKRKLALPVIVRANHHFGEGPSMETTLTGIHLRTGRTTLSREPDRNGVGHVYPAVDWIEGVLLKLRELDVEEKRLNDLIKPFEINEHRTRTYDNVKMPPEEYARLIDELEAEYNEKKALAEEGR